MKYLINHQTYYHYEIQVGHTVQELRRTPAAGPMQRIERWQLQAPSQLMPSRDGFGNLVHTFTLAWPSDTLVIQASGVVETLKPVESFIDDAEPGRHRVAPHYYMTATPLTELLDGIAEFAAPFLGKGKVGAAELLALTAAVADKVRYDAKATNVFTSAGEAFGIGAGVCQDQAHVLIACCRAHGLPARYVSGYFHAPNAPDLASHTWADICLDAQEQRWASLDVTHRCLTDERHVRLALGRDYCSAAPIRGVRRGGGDESLRVSVQIKTLG
ncbi:MAG: transglutaminase family protein [Candidatus Protistobacter heckmanni]|nr:transglutaminase family protein [Candidatus Protistobacter heckmanni]